MSRTHFYSNCLDCGCEEGGYHDPGCSFFGPVEFRAPLYIDARALARQYGVDAQVVGLEDGRIVLLGRSLASSEQSPTSRGVRAQGRSVGGRDDCEDPDCCGAAGACEPEAHTWPDEA